MMFWFSDVHKIHWKTPAIKVFLCKVTCCFTVVLWNSYFLKNPAMESFLSSQTWCFTKYVTLSQAFSSKLKNFFRAIFFRTPQERDFAKVHFTWQNIVWNYIKFPEFTEIWKQFSRTIFLGTKYWTFRNSRS